MHCVLERDETVCFHVHACLWALSVIIISHSLERRWWGKKRPNSSVTLTWRRFTQEKACWKNLRQLAPPQREDRKWPACKGSRGAFCALQRLLRREENCTCDAENHTHQRYLSEVSSAEKLSKRFTPTNLKVSFRSLKLVFLFSVGFNEK